MVDYNKAVATLRTLHEERRIRNAEELNLHVEKLFSKSVLQCNDEVGERKRLIMDYYKVDNKSVCLSAFCDAHNIAKYQFDQG